MRSADRGSRVRLNPEDRSAAILSAATSAFTTSSYDQVSVASVALAAQASEALVYRYFDTKAGLYTAVVASHLQQLAERRRRALSALPPNTSARDQVRVAVETLLDHVRGLRAGWASPYFVGAEEPAAAHALRDRYRAELLEELGSHLRDRPSRRSRLALVGFLGYLGAAAQGWVSDGCPEQDRGPLVEAALGALQGALGDWGSMQGAS